jgi:GT2 family glycosyltransferase
MARVIAVTIHHRGREMLDVCLATLLDSEGVELEIVVVLNGCDEDLPEVASSSPRVHVIETDGPVGFSEANNFGVDWAAGHLDEPDYYYFINNDTRSKPDALALQVAVLETDDRAAVAGPTLLIDWARNHLNSLGLNVTDDAWGWDEGIGIARADYGPLPARRPVVAVTGSAILVDASVYSLVGGWTVLYDYYFEDIDLCLKVRGAGYEVIHEPEAVVGHHVSATMTLESDYKNYLFWRNRLVLACVHWPLGMLGRLLKIAIVDEILRRPKEETETRRKALWGALKKVPRALGARWRHRGRKDWVELLVPRGSVPVITLPDRPSAVTGEPSGPSIPPRAWTAAEALEASGADGRRVLILGCSPLPFENQRMNLAPGVRTWQFARGLSDDGNAVCVAAMRIPGAHDETDKPSDRFSEAGVLVYTMTESLFRTPGVVDGLVDVFQPDVVIGAASTVPALRAVEVAGERPVWIDLFGDLLAEAQARVDVHPDEELLPYREVLVALLERGDVFSAVSDRQRFSVIGQLGLVGRLNRETAGFELVHTIPCCVVDTTGAGLAEAASGGRDELDPDAFVLLWSGGFNTWCDVDVLIAGVEKAMAVEPRLRLVVTGGSIRGHDDRSYPRFLDRVARSEFGDRIEIKGQLETAEADAFLGRADLGIVTEKKLTERMLGSSGRVLRWLAAGLPLVCTDVSELGSTMAERDLASVYRTGDSDDLARAILDAASDPAGARVRAERAREFASATWSIDRTTSPVRSWVRSYRRAPDARLDNQLALTPLVDAARRWPKTEADYHEVRSELGKIHQSRMWKIWMFYLGLTRFLRFRGKDGGPADAGDA